MRMDNKTTPMDVFCRTLVLFNGEVKIGVTAADDVEGWIDVFDVGEWVRPPKTNGPFQYPVINGIPTNFRREHGKVEFRLIAG